jgi:hypothetical protein
LFFLLQQFSLDQMMEFYRLKYPDGSKILVMKSLAYFSDADEDVTPRMLKQIGWDEIKKTITKQLLNYSKNLE